jgi:glutathione S-transferase
MGKEAHLLNLFSMATTTPTPSYVLSVGQKRYNSWGARPFILMHGVGIPFTEHHVHISGIGVNPALLSLSPSGLVPLLQDGALRVWDSLAIAEYLHERHPEARVWPRDPAARALARCVSAEMHSGFSDVRATLSFNLGYRLPAPLPLAPKVATQVARIEAIWRTCREAHGAPSGEGPYLFGAFGAADAMYAPVALRFHTYRITLPCAVAEAYARALRAHPHVRAWAQAALSAAAEEAPIPHYDEHLIALGGEKQESYNE